MLNTTAQSAPPSQPSNADRVLTREEAQAIYTYTLPEHRIINGGLRGQHPSNTEMQQTIRLIDSALEKLRDPALPARRTYRGVRNAGAVALVAVKRNDGFRDPGYISTAKALTSNNINWTINTYVRDGTLIYVRGRSGVDISQKVGIAGDETIALTKFPTQEEVLYPRNTQFRVLLNIPVDARTRAKVMEEQADRRLAQLEGELAITYAYRDDATLFEKRKLDKTRLHVRAKILKEHPAYAKSNIKAPQATRILFLDETHADAMLAGLEAIQEDKHLRAAYGVDRSTDQTGCLRYPRERFVGELRVIGPNGAEFIA